MTTTLEHPPTGASSPDPDGRTDVKCVAYKNWLKAWDEIKAS